MSKSAFVPEYWRQSDRNLSSPSTVRSETHHHKGLGRLHTTGSLLEGCRQQRLDLFGIY